MCFHWRKFTISEYLFDHKFMNRQRIMKKEMKENENDKWVSKSTCHSRHMLIIKAYGICNKSIEKAVALWLEFSAFYSLNSVVFHSFSKSINNNCYLKKKKNSFDLMWIPSGKFDAPEIVCVYIIIDKMIVARYFVDGFYIGYLSSYLSFASHKFMVKWKKKCLMFSTKNHMNNGCCQ